VGLSMMAISRLPRSSYTSVKHAIGGVNSVVRTGVGNMTTVVAFTKWGRVIGPLMVVAAITVAVACVAAVTDRVGARRIGDSWDIIAMAARTIAKSEQRGKMHERVLKLRTETFSISISIPILAVY
jgi:hypothetical protein